jgi:ArsR family transcriptional regulator, arsenate/arsenite/antimonite-responsive transcriptional repressor
LSINAIRRADAEEWSAWFRALADPTRLQVLNAIAAHGEEITIGELVARVQIGQSTVSHHVRVLADAGFVIYRRTGTSSRVVANRECFAALPHAARAILGHPDV